MLQTTIDACRAIFKVDPSICASDRSRILAIIRNHGASPEPKSEAPVEPHVLIRKEVASRFGRSLRFIDKLAAEGYLTRVKLPGRTRACGFLAEEVDRLLRDGWKKS